MKKRLLVGAALFSSLLFMNCSSRCLVAEMSTSAWKVGSYIRPQFYAAGRIDAENLQACQDVILFAAEPTADGGLYFKFDVWEEVCRKVQKQMAGRKGNLRLGVHHGDWRNACSEKYRARLVESVCRVVEQYQLDGVDLDFEWPTTKQEYVDYSATIVAMKKRLGKERFLSVSLHPTAYKISKEAIRAVDWISLQCYGPRPMRFSLATFQKDVQMALDYGIPAEKLVAGLPFYATAGKGVTGTVAYWQLVDAGVVTDVTADKVVWNGEEYTLNSQQTLRQKVRWARKMGLRGVMSWDLATDCAFSHPLSLQRVVVETGQE